MVTNGSKDPVLQLSGHVLQISADPVLHRTRQDAREGLKTGRHAMKKRQPVNISTDAILLLKSLFYSVGPATHVPGVPEAVQIQKTGDPVAGVTLNAIDPRE